MNEFDVYLTYNAMKQHFTQKSYDCIKYNFKTSAGKQAFFRRRDKFFFAKLARRFPTRETLIDYFAAHFAQGNNWVGDMLDNEVDYSSWISYNESMTYKFEGELNMLESENDSLDYWLKLSDNITYPPLINKLLQGKVSVQAVVILDKLTGFMQKANKHITETIVWPDLHHKLVKLKPFINNDTDRTKKSVLKVFTH